MTRRSKHLQVQYVDNQGTLLEDGALTIDEAVSWSGIGRSRLYAAMSEGHLPFVQKGARRLIPRKALRTLLAEDLVRCEPDLGDCG